MTLSHVRARAPSERLRRALDRLRDEIGTPGDFPAAALAEVGRSAAGAGSAFPAAPERRDARELAFIAIDPPGSRDLDQAFYAERAGRGYRVYYAIADVAQFVPPGGALDLEARTRGVTFYAPDGSIPLHPRALSEGAASLLPGQDTPALLWTLELDDTGDCSGARLERALVRNGAALTYAEAQRETDGDAARPALALLREIGRLRVEREIERGAISLPIPSQEVEEHAGQFRLRYERSLPIEGWNAQISLLTGMQAARLMLDAGLGLLRTLPPASPGALRELRDTARALDIEWPRDRSYPDFVRGLDPAQPAHVAVLTRATRVFRGAGYEAFRGAPEQRVHSAVAAPYAHVTAPLRRLADRFANEIVLAVCAEQKPPAWAEDALPLLPELMQVAGRRASALERATIDLLEAALLEPHVGEQFDAIVTDVRRDSSRVQLREPCVRARIDDASLPLGEHVRLRLLEANLEARRIRFEPV